MLSRMVKPATPHWQPALGRDGIVEGVDDIDQCIRIILTTPKGSDPLRPDFASNLLPYIDMPVDRARPHVVREVVAAITAWERRVSIIRVAVTAGGGDGGRVTIAVMWRIANGVTGITEATL